MQRIAGRLIMPHSDKSILRLCSCYFKRSFVQNRSSFYPAAGQHVLEPGAVRSGPASIRSFSVSKVEGLFAEKNFITTLSESESHISSSQDDTTGSPEQVGIKQAPKKELKHDLPEASLALSNLVKDSDAKERLVKALAQHKDAESHLVKMIQVITIIIQL